MHLITIAHHRNNSLSHSMLTERMVVPAKYISPKFYARLDEVYVFIEGGLAVYFP